MNGTPDNIIVNSCELTPIYLIQESGVAQATSYVLTPANQVEQKPVSNLKRFYESSGNLEKSVLLNNSEISKPRILKKPEGVQKGNNLKLASFLVPKTSATVAQTSASLVQNSATLVQTAASIVQSNGSLGQSSASIPQNSVPIVQSNASLIQNSSSIVQTNPTIVQNSALIVQNKPVQPVIFKPAVATVPAPSSNVGLAMGTISKIDMDRKIVKLKPCDTMSRHFHPRSVPKNKPKEVIPPPELPKYTSVQLLKLGETYHSLNVLSDDQVKMVNQALNIIKDPEKIPTEPAYDPVTNTRFIYKIVSPKDLKVVGKNKVMVKEPKRELRKVEIAHFDDDTRAPLGTVTTRSGRKVKLPRQPQPAPAPPRPRRRPGALVCCAQCSADFGSLYQLQKHYESNPTHAPAKIHSTLFHCLLAIVTSSPAEARAKLFLQQLEQLVHKLRALLPCLLQAGQGNSIGEDVGRIFGVNPGKYNINIDALNCVKDKEGHCKHNPPPPKPAPVVNQFSADVNKPSQLWLSKHNEEIANIETDDCARINTVHKWPTVGNKLWNIKQKTQKNYVKKMRLAPDPNEALIDLGKDLTALAPLTTNECPMNMQPQKLVSLLKSDNEQEMQNEKDSQDSISFEDALRKSKGPHIQFHSAHFDIRSSPIKPSSTVFRKFQINPERIEKLNVQVIRPLSIDQKPDEMTHELTHEITPTTSDCSKLDSIFRDDIEMTCKDVINNELNFDSSKNWAISSASNDDQSHDSFMKSNALIEPSLIHVKDVPIDSEMDSALPYSDMTQNADMPILDDSNDNPDNHDKLTLSQNQSVLNFLETLGNECLTYPEPEIRNTSVDFQLDLFSFNNT